MKLNGKTPQIAVPEWLFHYPFLILDPAENGEFKVGSNGTGAFERWRTSWSGSRS